jgi:RNA polymerase sigma-70 factor, ECF subfamily
VAARRLRLLELGGEIRDEGSSLTAIHHEALPCRGRQKAHRVEAVGLARAGHHPAAFSPLAAGVHFPQPHWKTLCEWVRSHQRNLRSLGEHPPKPISLRIRFHCSMGEKLNRERSLISVREKEYLLQRAQGGDAEAVNTLFESCRRSLYCQALRILCRPQDAEDAVQEAMMAAYKHLHRFQGRADFHTWASRIVINAALQQIRRSRRKPTVSWDQVDTQVKEAAFGGFLKDPLPTPEEQFQDREHQGMIEDALHRLSAEGRQALQFSKLDYSLKEAANRLGLPVSTLKARLHSARRALILRIKRKTQNRRKPSAGKRALPLRTASQETLRAA